VRVIKQSTRVELWLQTFLKSSLYGGERSTCKACKPYEKIPWYKFTRSLGEPRSWSRGFGVEGKVVPFRESDQNSSDLQHGSYSPYGLDYSTSYNGLEDDAGWFQCKVARILKNTNEWGDTI
jgi:hypothetical protein